jgi:hypothetical protein
MPRYFIDTTDGDGGSRDDEGEDFADAETARRCAIAHLPALADSDVSDGEPREVSVTLRGENGAALYVARLSFRGAWMGNALRRRAG